MIIVGLTGGIATGKSTVSKMIRQYGIPIIDADAVAREVVEPGQEVLTKIIEEFGNGIIFEDGTLNRQKLGSIVFSDSFKLKRLNAITHPEIRRRIRGYIDEYKGMNSALLVVDVPLLLENDFGDMVDFILLVYADEKTQLERLMERNNFTREEAMLRIKSQMSIKEKRKYADFIIDNTFDLKHTRLQLDEVLKKFGVLEEPDD